MTETVTTKHFEFWISNIGNCLVLGIWDLEFSMDNFQFCVFLPFHNLPCGQLANLGHDLFGCESFQVNGARSARGDTCAASLT